MRATYGPFGLSTPTRGNAVFVYNNTLCVFYVKKQKLFVGANVERELERSSARSFVRSSESESVNPVASGRKDRAAEELSSPVFPCFIIVVEEPHAVA